MIVSSASRRFKQLELKTQGMLIHEWSYIHIGFGQQRENLLPCSINMWDGVRGVLFHMWETLAATSTQPNPKTIVRYAVLVHQGTPLHLQMHRFHRGTVDLLISCSLRDCYEDKDNAIKYFLHTEAHYSFATIVIINCGI